MFHETIARMCVATQSALENPRLFALTQAALIQLNGAAAAQGLALCAAHLLKALAFLGLRPSLSSCVGCGAEMTAECQDAMVFAPFLFTSGLF